MPRIREYTQQVTPQGALNTSSTPDDFGMGIARGLAVLGDGLERFNAERKADAERTNLAAANANLSQFVLDSDRVYADAQTSAPPGADRFADSYLEDFDKRAETLLGTASDDKSREWLQERVNSYRTRYGSQAYGWEKDQRAAYRVGKLVEATETSAKVVNADENRYDEQVQDRISAIDADDSLPPDRREKLKTETRRALASSAVEGYIGRNPGSLARQAAPQAVEQAYGTATSQATDPQGSFDRAVKFVFGVEGGYVADDAGKGPTNFGINSVSNPDVDVKNLTKQQAQELYRQRYWNAIGGDKLDPKLAMVAFDTAVNMGPSAANRLLAQSGGDISRFVELRRDRYRELVRENPGKFGKYLSGWMDRLDKLEKAVGSVPLMGADGLPIPQIKMDKAAGLSPPEVNIPGWNDLTLDQQQRFLQADIQRFNQQIAVDRGVLNAERQDMHANLLAGNEYRDMAAVQEQYARAYGPEMAKRLIDEDKNVARLGAFAGGIRGRTTEEIAGMMGPPPGAGASADDYRTYAQMQKLVEEDRKKLRDDPVAYVTANDAGVKKATVSRDAAIEALREAGPNASPDQVAAASAATQQMVAASLAAQRRLGVANPQILSPKQEDALVQQLTEIAASGNEVASQIEQLYAAYGPYAPTVAQQVGKKVGGMLAVVGSGLDPMTASMLVDANRNKEDLKKTLADDQIKLSKEAVASAVAPFANSLLATPNGVNVLATYQEQIGLLAMSRMSRLGESPSEAASKAYEALVGSKYNFVGGYRVPKALDANQISRQADLAIRQMTTLDMTLLPSSTIGNPQDRARAQLAAVREGGRWFTSVQRDREGKMVEGLTLTLPTAGGFQAIPGPDGQPIFLSFGELALRDMAPAPATAEAAAKQALASGDMRAYERAKAEEKRLRRQAEDEAARSMNLRRGQQ